MAATPQDQIILYIHYHTPTGVDVIDFTTDALENGSNYTITLTSHILKNIPVDGYTFKYWMNGPIPEESTIYSVDQVIELPTNDLHLHLYGVYEPIVKQKNIKARY